MTPVMERSLTHCPGSNSEGACYNAGSVVSLWQEATLDQGELDPKLCQVVGLNQNYTSSAGTLYHVQIEDRGPVVDRVTEKPRRRVNVIVYANYGEPNARIIHGHDHDFDDLRTHEHNRFVEARIQQLAADARISIEEREQRLVMRVKAAIREYYYTKNESAKREFEEANSAYPFLFSRAWRELKEERARSDAASAEPIPEAPTPVSEVAPGPKSAEPAPLEVVYPLDAELREHVFEIERLIEDLIGALEEMRAKGTADDILVQTTRKLVTRARETLQGRQTAEFSARRLESTRNALATTWRQVRSRMRA
jgi:hypothetical protein